MHDDAIPIPRDYAPFLALEAATLIAGVGNGVAAIALPWLTLRLTNDPAAAGIVVAAGALPTLAASTASAASGRVSCPTSSPQPRPR